MVLDSSAIVAIHLREPGYERLIETVEAGMPLLFTGKDFARTGIAQA